MPAIRADERTHEIVRELAAEDNMSMADVLARAVEGYRRRRLLKRADLALVSLKVRSEGWAEQMEELALWDETVADGLGEAH